MRSIDDINKDLPQGHPLTDFRNFLYHVWEFLSLPEPTPIQYDVARAMMENGLLGLTDRKCIIQAPRGLGKSFVCGAYAVWRLMLNKDEKILVACGNESKAKEFTIFCNKIIHGMPMCQHLITEDGRKSALSFDVAGCSVAQAPSMKAAAIMGSIVGSRATIIIGDDVETPNSVETQGSREKLDARVKEFNDIIVPESQEVIFLGTPQSEDTVYDKLAERNHRLMVWTAEKISRETNESLYNNRVEKFCLADAASDVGEPTEPTRFPKSVLEVKKLEHGVTRYQQQFMLCPRLLDEDKYPLKIKDLIVTDLNADKGYQLYSYSTRSDLVIRDLENVGFSGDRYYEPYDTAGGLEAYTGRVMAIDPSGRGGDETGYAVCNMLNGYIFVMDAGGLKGGYDAQTLDKLAYIAKQWGVNKIIVESNFGDGMFNSIFSPVLGNIYPVSLEEVRHNTQKEKRICDTLEPVMNQHKLIFNKSVVRSDYDSLSKYTVESRLSYSLFYQLSRITRSRGSLKHDDRLDALAIAVNYWTEHMSQDAVKQIRRREIDMLESELRDFEANVIGSSAPRTPTWF